MFLNNKKGYSLFEMIIVILIISVLTTITLKSLKTSSDINRVEETKEELLQLAYSIAGNPNLVSSGKRTDFGYIGDIGALPVNLDALVQNPGGYT
ncbi:MAG: prepilin-type N-terminal cleavage/methylation domain-containing protein, partial [candidate division Zixibacteria bacterium]|nr:prepilin-type N-terminal cleavage/methylation domain-containing protein [candidate division Zixibacteria bacterium]